MSAHVLARRRSPRVLRLLAVAACALAVWGVAPAAARAAGFSWSSPVSIDNRPPYAEGPALGGISCPSTTLCVGVGPGGDVLTSIKPTGGFGSWTLTQVDTSTSNSLVGISCPSTTLCVAADSGGNVVTSTNPAGGAGAWTASQIPGMAFDAISCASSTLCVAVDDAGNVATSTNPAGGAATWQVAAVDPGATLTSVSCATVPSVLCAATDTAGNLVTSTDPTGGANAWTLTPMGPDAFASVSCPSATLCVGAGLESAAAGSVAAAEVLASTNPTGGASAWTAAEVDPGQDVQAVSCISTTLCYAFDTAGNLLTSGDPQDGPSAWTLVGGVDAAALGGMRAISCALDAVCVAIDGDGDVVATTDPTGDAGAWTVTRVDGSGTTIESVSCQSEPLCVAGDDAGDALWSTGAGGGATAWQLANIDGSNAISGLSCPSSTQCVAVDDAGNAVTSVNPTGGAGAWAVSAIDGTDSLTGVSCPSTSLCVAVDNAGNILSSTDPVGGDWQSAQVDSGNALESVSCASSTLCVAVDDAGNVAISSDPADGKWTVANVDGSVALDGVSCAPASTVCVIVGSGGAIFVTPNPTAATGAWTATPAGDTAAITSVSCVSASLCVAADSGGSVLTANDPTGGGTPWSVSLTDVTGGDPPDGRLLGVSCTLAQCVAVDADGNELVGTPLPPAGPFTLNVSIAGSGSGAVSGSGILCGFICSDSYATGTAVTLTATPDSGSSFTGWSGGGCSGTGACVVTMTAAESVTASFAPAAPTLDFQGYLQLSIAGSGSVLDAATTVAACPGTCADDIGGGEYTAVPAAGWEFSGWTGECDGAAVVCEVPALALDTVGALGATFIPVPPVVVTPTGTASAPPPAAPAVERVRIRGASVTFTFAKPPPGGALQCALVKHASGQPASAGQRRYATCAITKTYRGLRRGSYTLYLRTLAGSGLHSSPSARSFRIVA
jgi:List-Bact-rpt repeat protein